MSSYIVVQNSPRTNFHGDENVVTSKSRADRNEKVAGDGRLGVVPDKRAPSLSSAAWSGVIQVQVFSNSSRRDQDAEFEIQFVGDPLLSPNGIRGCNLLYQFSDVGRQGRSSAPLPRLPAPEKAETRPMPFDEGIRFDNDKCFAPIKKARERHHG
jgi:hypothetical protein